ncbi:biotin--[acetyl-CoA-carboxylase] ligase [Altererythrobacter sp.]|uniref:biotin--[acetyl-CoA-carboxylase] ligase n=1 Tax=Altererythrobacter sp. TaxID=1872480 RepID=UPI001B11ABB6|nr:biotin--[acetyl-CoA-carboxylase] ligase [Altererythrobacter sp.]MBO6608260.1 biotin--[acetyl-CoA-carboxylase] ligase [Altererythrobacter sp.]MBO6641484.1 biotin--[acetyl-CoA-carboxylase] ligase [Altererythrobacter sp.]MBO6707817.1 biotin--[acetyl-CoA-carboxylase] ligase [Altererythrobacter sp.]MBO6946051.1 biotin--[acetyl-CoA-carboxylase] ligase [Altererythrobacter sp.]
MIRFVDETGSTNADLLSQLSAGEPLREGDWLVARRQVSGRGRQGREWFDGAGNFMGSTIVRPASGDPAPHTLALMSGLAVYEALLPHCPDPSALMLKWPNDILLGGAKLVGILLESSSGAVVVGIGVNLRAAPDLPDRQTVALSKITNPPSLENFADRLAASFDTELERWRNHGLGLLLRRWQAAAHPLGSPLTVHDPSGEKPSGTFAGLDVNGSLLLRDSNGKTRTVHAGDVDLD